MRIPEHQIEQIRSMTSIVDFISEYVQLKKRGKNFIGLCPFHNEKTPSFTVSEEKQIFHCFGCHAGGNIYKFLMEYEKISFVEAVQELATKLGVDLELEQNASDEQQNELEELYELNKIAGRYFSDSLLKNPIGENAKLYFENRKLNIKSLRVFGLGYSPNARDSFIKFAESKNLSLEKLITLGLIGQSEKGQIYDRYPGRIIFPIFSPNGRVIAFAGRKLDPNAGGGKYINSPETPVYVKGRTLYGLSHTKDEIRRKDKVLLVEGYMDLISLFQNEIKNVVAVSGTALTEEQIQLLSRYTKNVVLLFDSDTAGIKASMRSIELLLKKEFEIKITTLPEGEDPDSFINKFGKEEFNKLVEKGSNFLEYQTAYFESIGMFSDIAKSPIAIRELVRLAALIDDELKRSLLLKSIAKKFNLREILLEDELKKALLKISKADIRQSQIRKNQNIFNKNRINETKPSTEEDNYNLQTERDLIKLLFEDDSEVTKYILDNIKTDDFSNKIHQNIFYKVMVTFTEESNSKPSELLEKFDDDETQLYLRELLLDKYTISQKWTELMPVDSKEKIIINYTTDVVNKMKFNVLNKMIKENFENLSLAETEEEKFNLIKIGNDLKKQKNILNIK